jgi:hypothetical protein
MWPLRVVGALRMGPLRMGPLRVARPLRMVFLLRGGRREMRLRRGTRSSSRRCGERRCGSTHLHRDALANLGDTRTQGLSVLRGEVPRRRVLGHKAREAIESELGAPTIVRGHRRPDIRQLLTKPGCFPQCQLRRLRRRAAAADRDHRQHRRYRQRGPSTSPEHTPDDGNARQSAREPRGG